MDGFVEFFWDEFVPTLPGWMVVLGAVFLVSVVVVCRALGGDAHADVLTRAWFAGVFSEISMAMLSTIVVGAVIKVLVVQGYFERALTEVVFGVKGLDRVGNDRRIELWKALTCRIHAPFIHERIESDTALRDFYTTLLAAEEKQISYNQNFYIGHTMREMKFSWFNDDKTHLKIVDFMKSNLIPFDTSQAITWKSSRFCQSGEQIDAYTCSDTDLKITGEDISKRVVNKVNNETEEETIYKLNGLQQYKISRTRT